MKKIITVLALVFCLITPKVYAFGLPIGDIPITDIFPPPIETVSDTVVLTVNNVRGKMSNSGATGIVTYVLPLAGSNASGWEFSFIISSTSYDFLVRPNSVDIFTGMYTTASTGSSLKGDLHEGSVLKVVCKKNISGVYVWYTSGFGAWSDNGS